MDKDKIIALWEKHLGAELVAKNVLRWNPATKQFHHPDEVISIVTRSHPETKAGYYHVIGK